MRAHRAFTLVELMLAASLVLLVIGGAAAAFIGIQRMTRTVLAESELAVEMRLLREKLLFHLEPPRDGHAAHGLLSTNAVASADAADFAKSDWLNGSLRNDWTAAAFDEASRAERHLYFVNLAMSAEGVTRSADVTRRERIVVPVFGETAGKGDVFGE